MFAATPAASTRQRWAGPRVWRAGDEEAMVAQVFMTGCGEVAVDAHSLAPYIHPENRKVFDESFDKTG
ncbi:hypothetical protein [Burkholderia ubonensis]|uniref:hypothetical protein n=1 Tax=Burkholderia ubonensis TaxID=101571 RepID=UPI0018E06390|nr:hypothetical protein [Burkholderia ubonensis]